MSKTPAVGKYNAEGDFYISSLVQNNSAELCM